MLDNQLIQLFYPIISSGLIANGFSGVNLNQSYQPVQQGANSPPSIYFYKLFDKRYGYLERTNVWDSINSQEIHTETQQYETTFQVNAWSQQDPTNINFVTASDLVNMTAAIMQSDSARKTLLASSVGILRVTDVRNPYFVDDFDRHEASPSFDFTLTHYQQITSTVDINQDVILNIYRVL